MRFFLTRYLNSAQESLPSLHVVPVSMAETFSGILRSLILVFAEFALFFTVCRF